jgi:hypothetical protein
MRYPQPGHVTVRSKITLSVGWNVMQDGMPILLLYRDKCTSGFDVALPRFGSIELSRRADCSKSSVLA